jgi:hypothetical protein
MTDRRRQDDQPTEDDQPEPKRPTLNKETIRDLDPDPRESAYIKGGDVKECTAGRTGCG